MLLSEQLDLIKKHQTKCPVQTISIAAALKLKVFKSAKGMWPNNFSGMIRRSKNDLNSYEIYTNGDHHIHRRRFTIAHEIAHYVLHKDYIGDGITEDALYRSGLSTNMEIQANRLAADILMPWHLLDEKLDNGVSDIEELAELFEVSKSSMSIRMRVPWETDTK